MQLPRRYAAQGLDQLANAAPQPATAPMLQVAALTILSNTFANTPLALFFQSLETSTELATSLLLLSLKAFASATTEKFLRRFDVLAVHNSD
jgi:hypothetical protein